MGGALYVIYQEHNFTKQNLSINLVGLQLSTKSYMLPPNMFMKSACQYVHRKLTFVYACNIDLSN